MLLSVRPAHCAAAASAPQRALLSALHEALLAIARHHVEVGKAGLKFAVLEGGGRLMELRTRPSLGSLRGGTAPKSEVAVAVALPG